jgi:hypothetical protein
MFLIWLNLKIKIQRQARGKGEKMPEKIHAGKILKDGPSPFFEELKGGITLSAARQKPFKSQQQIRVPTGLQVVLPVTKPHT